MVAALLATTALTPTGALALPVVGFVLGATGATSIAAGLGISAGFAAGAVFGASFLGSLAIKTVVSIGLAALSASLAPTPRTPPPSARMVNFSQPISYAAWSFARTRKGGVMGVTGWTTLRRY